MHSRRHSTGAESSRHKLAAYRYSTGSFGHQQDTRPSSALLTQQDRSSVVLCFLSHQPTAASPTLPTALMGHIMPNKLVLSSFDRQSAHFQESLRPPGSEKKVPPSSTLHSSFPRQPRPTTQPPALGFGSWLRAHLRACIVCIAPTRFGVFLRPAHQPSRHQQELAPFPSHPFQPSRHCVPFHALAPCF